MKWKRLRAWLSVKKGSAYLLIGLGLAILYGILSLLINGQGRGEAADGLHLFASKQSTEVSDASEEESRAQASAMVTTQSSTVGSSTDTEAVTETSGTDAASESRNDGISVQERPVYITGAVKQPGVYQMGKMGHLYELVDRAGGLLEEADVRQLNLAMPIEALAHYDIPFEGEEVSIEGRAFDTTSAEARDAQNYSAKREEDAGMEKLASSGKIDLNRASREELCQVRGIGPKLAEAIIQYREQVGAFKSLEELKQVKGIKNKKFLDISEGLYIESP
ncbi:MAG: helix-hairpin-helix domain-containing protein [Eubacteriales bacterium]|nr:helix-hairpin-helix domain-containing protein [Eubacteriales bacterium]